MRKIFFLIILALLLAQSAFAQDDECFAVNGQWDTERQACVLKHGLDIQITYPLELQDSAFAQEAVNEFINTRRSEFVGFFLDGVNYYSPGPWSLYIDYEIYLYGQNTVSYLFTLSDYTGGAHPNHYFHSLVFDFDSESLVTWDDLFSDEEAALAIIAPFVQAELSLQQGEFADPQWIADGTGQDPANYQVFVLGGESLLFFFPPYQVGPYAAGSFTVEMPLSDLSSVLSDKLSNE